MHCAANGSHPQRQRDGKRRISIFSRREIHPELKRQKYAMMKLWLATLGNAVFFRERDDGDGRDGLLGSGERRERPSRRWGKEVVTVSGVTIAPS